ncbi:thioester domain-containing protein [Bacillus paramycoides]|uniref:thioester domain-containing protein n=1 Tax=Bacillus paramycoides TaxID=2026194 RepID=UPI0011AAC02B|nr:thioester domain-containing protein [Bacillus paramycoides]
MERKMIGKWFSFLSALIILLGIGMPQVKAEVMNRETYEMDWSYSKAKDREIKTEIIKTASGSIAYCLTPDLRSPNGDDLPEMGKTSDAVYRVLLNGYPQKSPSELGVATVEEAHYATQLAVWIAANELTEEDLVAKNKQVHNLMKRLVEASKKETGSQDVFFKVNPIDPQTAIQKGDYLETGFYAIQTNAVSGSYTILPENAPKGIRIVNERGEEKSTLSINEKFKIIIPKDTISGNFKMKVKSTLTNLQAIAFKGSGKVQNTTILLQRNSEKISTDLIVNWESVGSLKIMKLGEKKEVLKDAVFEVSNETFKQNVTTNDKGIAELGNLPIGIYNVKEIQAPAGYVLDSNVKKIEVKTGETALLEMKNENVKGELEITKVDVADGNTKLPNAEFTIYNEQGKEVAKGKTNEQGVAKFKLLYGKYTYKETIAPNGYVMNEETFSFEIKENGEIIKHIVQDKKVEGELEITKVDVADGNTKLPNAEFTIYNEQGKEVAKGKTNEQGVAKFKLPYGKYTYKETIAPNGYVMNEETFSFEIKENGEIIKHIVQDKKVEGELEITKVDVADGNTKLPNAEFTIYNEQGKEVAKGKTNEQGVAKFKLPYGKYTYKETIAPNGYVMNEETFSFEIKENGEIIKHTVKNKKEEKPSTTPKPDQPQTPGGEVKPSTDDVKSIEKPAKDEVRLPMTGGTKEFALLFILGIGFIIAGAYVLRMRQKV